jgi:hypothetical protein
LVKTKKKKKTKHTPTPPPKKKKKKLGLLGGMLQLLIGCEEFLLAIVF